MVDVVGVEEVEPVLLAGWVVLVDGGVEVGDHLRGLHGVHESRVIGVVLGEDSSGEVSSGFLVESPLPGGLPDPRVVGSGWSRHRLVELSSGVDHLGSLVWWNVPLLLRGDWWGPGWSLLLRRQRLLLGWQWLLLWSWLWLRGVLRLVGGHFVGFCLVLFIFINEIKLYTYEMLFYEESHNKLRKLVQSLKKAKEQGLALGVVGGGIEGQGTLEHPYFRETAYLRGFAKETRELVLARLRKIQEDEARVGDGVESIHKSFADLWDLLYHILAYKIR